MTTYDVRLSIAGGASTDAPVYYTEVLMQLSDEAYQTLAAFATPTVDPRAAAPAQPWVITTGGNLLQAIAAGKLNLPQIKPEIFQYLQLISLVEPGKIGISVEPAPGVDMSAAVTLSAT